MSEPEVEGKRVSWAELFFDLVFVFAITQLAALLHQDHGWRGIGATVVLFLPIYWVWVGTTMQANLATWSGRANPRGHPEKVRFAAAAPFAPRSPPGGTSVWIVGRQCGQDAGVAGGPEEPGTPRRGVAG